MPWYLPWLLSSPQYESYSGHQKADNDHSHCHDAHKHSESPPSEDSSSSSLHRPLHRTSRVTRAVKSHKQCTVSRSLWFSMVCDHHQHIIHYKPLILRLCHDQHLPRHGVQVKDGVLTLRHKLIREPCVLSRVWIYSLYSTHMDSLEILTRDHHCVVLVIGESHLRRVVVDVCDLYGEYTCTCTWHLTSYISGYYDHLIQAGSLTVQTHLGHQSTCVPVHREQRWGQVLILTNKIPETKKDR